MLDNTCPKSQVHHSISADILFSQIKNDLSVILENLDNYTSTSKDCNSSTKRIFNFFNIFQNKFKLKYTRTNLLLKFISTLNQSNERFFNSKFIIDYCIVIELLHLSSEIHSLIESDTSQSSLAHSYKVPPLEQIVLFGDLLFTISFEYLIKINNYDVLNHFSKTTLEMADYEAKLSEILNTQQSVSDKELLDHVNQKYWPLFNSIIFFYELLNPSHLDLAAIKNEILLNSQIYTLDKIIDKRVFIKKTLFNQLYKKTQVKYFKKYKEELLNLDH